MIFLWFGDRAGYCAHWAASGVGAVYARFLFLLPNGEISFLLLDNSELMPTFAADKALSMSACASSECV